MNLDDFGAVIDDFLRDNPVSLLVNLPEGTLEPEIEDNIGLGPVVQMYLLMQTLKKVVADVWSIQDEGQLILDQSEKGEFLDNILELIKNEIMEGLEDE